ncbi:MAG: protein-L-isoaspartate(D-aspartate) O-methyltransferase [Candidatus Brocadiia bacterium]
MNNYADLRAWMVDTQIVRRGIRDAKVIEAFRKVPRHLFVSEADRSAAYGDYPVRIDCGQTISQPYIVALMTQLLNLTGIERVLEIGTGSGYSTAILAEIGCKVFSVERFEDLHVTARKHLAAAGYSACSLLHSDGTLGWPEHAPFDRIVVTAGAPAVPEALLKQLSDVGILVAPVGDMREQTLVVVTRKGDSFEERMEIPCIFVPLIGANGWPE